MGKTDKIMVEPIIAPNQPDLVKDHVTRYIESKGEDGHLWDAAIGGGEGMIPTLLLTTIGRKSGKPLIVPLIYGETAGGYVLIASKVGAPAHPAWYLNLKVQPEVNVQVKADKFTAQARVADREERARLWQQMVGIYSPYEKYQEKTDRQIPVVVLDLVAD